jgi:hypothetical protein
MINEERVCPLSESLAPSNYQLRMHFGIVSLKLVLRLEGFLTMLTGIPGMYFAIMSL